ncbi:DUF1902 domain-containing protein [Pleomorphomonas sp. PLEO]|uniref:DUF1902 domain-containing protein n=1 Tax=Pleomorphomonas sp. PLEO TaxID=3239306 RepID=UPI00351EF2DC
MKTEFLVTATWDDEAEVWVATSDDIPGLVTEAPNLDLLRERILAVVPELLEDNVHLLNDEQLSGGVVNMCVLSELKLDGRHAA